MILKEKIVRSRVIKKSTSNLNKKIESHLTSAKPVSHIKRGYWYINGKYATLQNNNI